MTACLPFVVTFSFNVNNFTPWAQSSLLSRGQFRFRGKLRHSLRGRTHFRHQSSGEEGVFASSVEAIVADSSYFTG